MMMGFAFNYGCGSSLDDILGFAFSSGCGSSLDDIYIYIYVSDLHAWHG